MSEEQAEPRRVLVAEDEGLIRLDIVETLTQAGFEVVGEAADGEEAVELALELEPDLCVMDVKMPKMDGITAAEKILQELSCAVVMLTAFSQTELVERARDAGAMAYVVKPFSPSDLIPAVEIALSRHAEIESLEDQIADLSDRFETRKRVDRAKGLLMKNMGMSEPEAFRWIQKTSMDRRLSMREVADAVINLFYEFGWAGGGGRGGRTRPATAFVGRACARTYLWRGRTRIRLVTRATEMSLSASSRISTVCTVEERPRWTAVAVAVTVPSRPAPMWDAFSSVPTAKAGLPGLVSRA